VPSQDQDLVQELVARIATLEKTLEEERNNHQNFAKVEPMPDICLVNLPSGSSILTGSTNVITSSISPSPIPQNLRLPSVPDEEDRRDKRDASSSALLRDEVYTTLTAHAQLSFGHHGEFVGRGSFICALYSVSSVNYRLLRRNNMYPREQMSVGPTARFLYATSTNATSACRDTTLGLSSIPPAEREHLIQSLPPKPVATVSFHRFFTKDNWRFGIPEQWFQTACAQMWTALEYPTHDNMQINANWLSLFFAVLAIAVNNSCHSNDSSRADDNRGVEPTDRYFMYAMTARRIAEDDYLNKPNVSIMASAADGTGIGCLAVPLLCCYLAQRGRVSEAWKLVGSGIRTAEAIGMHRDPEWIRWQVMSKDEIHLRRTAWWGLVIWDKYVFVYRNCTQTESSFARMYSYLLGRPHMVRKSVADVAIPSYIEPDGSANRFNRGLVLFTQLADIAEETLEKV
jgi:Fungal specific transcription factor domain